MTQEDIFHKEVSEYYDSQLKKLISAIKKVAKKPDEINIHKARIAIKKVTAFFHFLEYCNGGLHNEQELKSLHKLFKQMGKIRDYENGLKLCVKFQINTAVFDDKISKQKKAYKKLHALCQDSKQDIKLIKKTGSKQLCHTGIKKWRAYITHELETITNEVASKQGKETLHPMRKDIKHIVYNSAIHNINGLITTAQRDVIDELQDAIGAWHDLTAFRNKPGVVKYILSRKQQATAIRKEEQKLYKAVMDGCRKTKNTKKISHKAH